MQLITEAYLDIETTGLYPWNSEITVIGIHFCNGSGIRTMQLVGNDITAQSILEAPHGVEVLYTYNGSRFDLLFIYTKLGINLAKSFRHQDLMYDCWNRNLYGGFNGVERQLGIERKLTEVNGYEAVKLWCRYVDSL
ncbi:ribonuclease H-like domain-containing protein [Chloroflexota bacterium]